MKLSQSLRANALIYLVDEVVRIQSRFSTLFADVRALAGLKNMETTVFMAVLEAVSPPTVPQIGRSLGHPRQVVQRAVDTLEQQGLIEKQANPDHKRAPLLVATDRGWQLKEASDARALAVAEAFLDGGDDRFDDNTCRQLGDELHALRLALETFARGHQGDGTREG